jgi:hypothetical protein
MNPGSILNLNETSCTLQRNAWGRLVLTLPDGSVCEGVQPVRAFPIQAPQRYISLVDGTGHEVAWVDDLERLPAPLRALIEQALGEREFMPEIRAILSVSTFATPSTWRVRTDRGETSFVLKGEEDIRRLTANTLLVTDSHGIQFLIRDITALDRESRRLLDRFK